MHKFFFYLYKFESYCDAAWINADLEKVRILGAEYFLDLIHYLIKEDLKDKQYKIYISESLKNISTILLRRFGDDKTEIPSYHELADKTDTKTDEEAEQENRVIYENAVNRFKEECERFQRNRKINEEKAVSE